MRARNHILARWNDAEDAEAFDALLSCCGAARWSARLAALRPFGSITELSTAADRVWATMEESDWLEAFARHPRIGERDAAHVDTQSIEWARQEQATAASTTEDTLSELAIGNALYEHRFGFTYIVCATGKSVDEMLAILKRRLENDRSSELREAAEQQRQIMQIRLGKWLAS